MSESKAKTVTIEGKEYPLDDFSEDARKHLLAARAAEQEMARLQALLGMVTTARNTYLSVLKRELGVNDSTG